MYTLCRSSDLLHGPECRFRRCGRVALIYSSILCRWRGTNGAVSGDLGRLPSWGLMGRIIGQLELPSNTTHCEDPHDWQSHVHHRSDGRFRNHLVRPARKCGPLRWKLEHGRRDDPRPLRNHRRWSRNKPRPNSFDRRVFRFLLHSVGRPRFRLRASQDESNSWPTYRQWNRTVQ